LARHPLIPAVPAPPTLLDGLAARTGDDMRRIGHMHETPADA